MIQILTPPISIFANPFGKPGCRSAGNSHPILIHVAYLAWSSGRQWLTSAGRSAAFGDWIWGDNWTMGGLLDDVGCIFLPKITCRKEDALGLNLC